MPPNRLWWANSKTCRRCRPYRHLEVFHDLRRSAIRNMERAGMPRNVAMGITGHRTEAVYRRYDIVSEKDMKLAASRMDEFFQAQRKDQKEKDLDAKRGKSGTNWAQ